MQAEQLEVLEQQPSVAMHDGLGRPGRTRRVEDGERVLEGHRLDRDPRAVREELLPRHALRGCDPARSSRCGMTTTARRLGSASATAVTSPARSMTLVAVSIAVDRDEHHGLDLAETIDHRSRAQLRRARRPDGSEAGGSEEGHERLGDVGDVGSDPVPASDPQGRRGRSGRVRPGREAPRPSAPSARASVTAPAPRRRHRLAR